MKNLVLVSVVAVIGVGCAPQHDREAVAKGMSVVAKMTEEKLQAELGTTGAYLGDAWLGRTGKRCGLVKVYRGTPPQLRFFELPDRSLAIEGRAEWSPSAFAGECSDRTADLINPA